MDASKRCRRLIAIAGEWRQITRNTRGGRGGCRNDETNIRLGGIARSFRLLEAGCRHDDRERLARDQLRTIHYGAGLSASASLRSGNNERGGSGRNQGHGFHSRSLFTLSLKLGHRRRDYLGHQTRNFLVSEKERIEPKLLIITRDQVIVY